MIAKTPFKQIAKEITSWGVFIYGCQSETEAKTLLKALNKNWKLETGMQCSDQVARELGAKIYHPI